ncbi:MAG TPA: helix-turn-helix domain-containing protein, partial [Fibrobacteraceae bacterium]|nr:helix-turn-helix domain-containing protein [Fibrobacteraceae bacterium]
MTHQSTIDAEVKMEESTQERKETRREQIKQQTREDILQATAQLIARKGISNLSMDEVAALAGLSKGSLYNYFSNR